MYNVMDVARYVINYSNDRGISISNLKLQKLLYFIQAYYLGVKKGDACFREDFQAWNFGPVIPEVYREYKNYGSSNISRINKYFKTTKNILDTKLVPYDDSVICDEDKQDINAVVEGFANYSATDLVNITHNQDPWLNSYIPGCNVPISKNAIKEYFCK